MRRVLVILTAGMLNAINLLAMDCQAVSQVQTGRILDFVRTHYHLSPALDLKLEVLGPADSNCSVPLRVRSVRDSWFDCRLTLLADRVHIRSMANTIYDIRVEFPERKPDGETISVVVFIDYQCPACAALFEQMEENQLLTRRGIQWKIRHFPLPQHPWARKAAIAAECAARQNAKEFRAVSRHLFAHRRELSDAGFFEGLPRMVGGIDVGKYNGCLARSAAAPRIDQDVALGRRLGVQGTPWIFLNGQHVSQRDLAELD